ncbi:glycosyltransferase [Lentisalinibacter orientalis]|uniref:glycosyltransferase n=1 Tax=Lentisalinibacter orientalis TaxID=2992241 RepID=UPI00386E0C2F
MPRVLMVAYHFPPASGTSGVQRALRFASYLPDFGWEPIVLTATPGVYEHHNPDLLSEVPRRIPVIRAPALDTKRHLAIGGRYPGFLARPDRWQSWWLGAVPAGLRAIRRYKPSVIWSTYPIATAHRIGCTLARLSGLPLVADFRDPMAQEGYPADPATWRSFKRIESRTIACAARSVFTTPGARALYGQRYPAYAGRLEVIENGYDEGAFEAAAPAAMPLNHGRVTLLHSGVVYASERDPTALFAALAKLKDAHPAVFERIMIRFRASMADELLTSLAQRYDVSTAIELLPSLSYRDALGEMQAADGLLILQAANCNQQIPAKIYEYLRARRPLLVLSDPAGDTVGVARNAGVDKVAPLDDAEAITGLLAEFVSTDDRPLPLDEAVRLASRYARTQEFARLLDSIVLV